MAHNSISKMFSLQIVTSLFSIIEDILKMLFYKFLRHHTGLFLVLKKAQVVLLVIKITIIAVTKSIIINALLDYQFFSFTISLYFSFLDILCLYI